MAQVSIPNEEELQIVKDFLISPIVLDVLGHDMKKIKEIELKMSKVYLMKLKSVQLTVMKDAYEIRSQMKQRGIKVYEQERTKKSLDAKYLFRGYHYNCSLLWTLVKTEVELILCKYLEIDITDEKLR